MEPCVESRYRVGALSIENANKMCEDRLPDTEFELVHKIRHKYIEVIEIEVSQCRKCILLFRIVIGNRKRKYRCAITHIYGNERLARQNVLHYF